MDSGVGMSEKQEILDYIQNLATYGIVTKEELVTAFDHGLNPNEAKNKKISIQDIMYYIGAAIVFFGLVIMVGQNWENLSDFSKVAITLGSGVIAFISGTLFIKYEQTERVGIAFHLIAALILPLGIGVTFEVASLLTEMPYFQTLISSMLFVMYVISYGIFRKDLFLLFTIIFGTWLFFAIVGWLVTGTLLLADNKVIEYQVLITGLIYMLLAYYFSFQEKKALTGFLYGFGVFVFLGGAFLLGGWQFNTNYIWELVFPVLVFGILFLSVYFKRTSFLTFGTIYLMLYILKITSIYFSSGLGWPLALVCAGFLLIATGYLSFYLKKKFLSIKKPG